MTSSNIKYFSFCFLSFNVVLYLIFTLEPLLLRTAQNASLVGGRDDEKFSTQPIRSLYGAFTDQWLALLNMDAARCLPFTLFAKNVCAKVHNTQSTLFFEIFFLFISQYVTFPLY